MDKPSLSVVIASYNSRRYIRACLDSLRQQDFPGSFEVIVVDSSSDGTGAIVGVEFPQVNLIRCSTRKFPGEARNLGIAEAQGDIICFLDADCIASPDWLSQVWRAHFSPDPVIGGCIDNGARDNVVGWASYFTSFSRWMPGTSRGRVSDIPACNLTFKRWILVKLGPLVENVYSEDCAYSWRMRKEGYPEPLFEPAIAVSHYGITGFIRYIAHDLERGQSFSRMRVAVQGFGLLRRLAYAMAFPLIYIVLCSRMILRILRNRLHFAKFCLAFPLVLLGLLAWSVGEVIGYVRGPERAYHTFSR